MNLKRLHAHHKIYFDKLYPFYLFNKKPIRFSTVQNQSNAYDCGVFVIAFAVSLLFGLRPDTVMYDHTLMRQHLAYMFQSEKIEHFPRIIRSNDSKKLFSLDEIQKRETLARKKRKRRQKKAKQENSIDLIKLRNDITEMTLEKGEKKYDKMSDQFDRCIIKKNNVLNKCNDVKHSIHGTFKNSFSSLYIATDETQNNEKNYTNNFPTCIQENKLLRDDSSCITKINEYKYTSFVADILPLSMQYIQIIFRGEWLEDIHIDYFNLLLKNCSEYQSRESWKIQCPDRIEPVPKNQKHIQILHSCSDIAINLDGHWICSYYDTNVIYIYDSLNIKRLHAHHKIYLEKLYPFYSFDKQSVQFPTVQSQPNGNDCGVFAIAFAVSLLFDLQPNRIIYNHNLMRQHLKMFQLNRIEHFPQITETINSEHIDHTYEFSEGSIGINNITVIKDLTRDQHQHDLKRKINSHNCREIDSNKKQNKNSDIYTEDVLSHKANVICTNNKSVLNKIYYELHRNDLLTKKCKYNKKHNDIKKSNKEYYEKHKNDIKKSRKEY